jgi:ketosteroid isomerase-like protein
MQLTIGQAFYHRLCAAIEAQDLATLEALYHPDAVSISLSTGQIFKGREAILDSFKQTFQITGSISPKSVESLVEAGGAVCVEATMLTRFAEIQSYDVYMLQAGKVQQHFGGLISPRPPLGQQQGQGTPQTRGQAFYRRLCTAIETQDLTILGGVYHPDAVSISSSTNQFLQGREAIISSLKQSFQNGGFIKLKSVESFVETEEVICAEATETCKLGTPMGGVQFDTLSYEVYILRAGKVQQHFGGLISPRVPALKQFVQQALQQQSEQQAEIAKTLHQNNMRMLDTLARRDDRRW